MTDLAIEAQQISQRFGGVHALENVSFSVPPAQIRGIIGPNGAGKTTLLNVLSGVQRPTSGRVCCFGQDVVGWPPHRIAQHARVVRTFQNIRLFPTMNLFDNILVASQACDESIGRRFLPAPGVSHTARERAERVLVQLKLDNLRSSRVTQLPYGTRRKVEIARALVMQPRVLLLDEPAAGLNGAERAELGQLLRDLQDRGLTVILVEHQMDLVSRVCDELTVLDFGRVICDGAPSDVVNNPAVLEAYLGTPGEET